MTQLVRVETKEAFVRLVAPTETTREVILEFAPLDAIHVAATMLKHAHGLLKTKEGRVQA